MYLTAHLLLFLLMMTTGAANDTSYNDNGFTFNGNLKLGGLAEVRPDGIFKLTNATPFSIGHAFYSSPFRFKNSSDGNDKALSFSTTFVFSIVPEGKYVGHGMAFVIAPSKGIPGASSSQYLGLFNRTNNGDSSNHIIALELDTFQNQEFGDINSNHVGIDINSLESVKSAPAGYFSSEINGEEFNDLTLASGKPMQAWVDYDGIKKQLNVTLAPINTNQPALSLLSLDIDISPIVLDQMYVGFSSSTGALLQSSYVLGWSFQMNKKAELNVSHLPSLPHAKWYPTLLLATVLPTTAVVSVLLIFLFWTRRMVRFTEGVEEWEVEYGTHKFPYKDLFIATKGFPENELLGRGGFGQVYRGVLEGSNLQVAVKKISQGSRQGLREFIAEIATIGRIRHPNLVRLLGYCRRKGELFLIYDFMPNASLDKFLFNKKQACGTLNWNQRFKIINDVASGLAYLHEEWVKVIVHRDIKSSNVLLDSEMNGVLGDFGLARCSNHGEDPQTTNIAGTRGYIAPELTRSCTASTSTDVYAFGVFCLEVACGRRPMEARGAEAEKAILMNWVLACLRKGEILKTADPKLQRDYNIEEMELVLKVGLLCSHPAAEIRPRMSRVLVYLKGDESLPGNLDALWTPQQLMGLSEFGILHHSSSQSQDSKPSLTITELFTSRGR